MVDPPPLGGRPAAIRRWFDAAAQAEIPEYDGTLKTARAAGTAYARRAKAENTRRAHRARVRTWCARCQRHALPCLPGRPRLPRRRAPPRPLGQHRRPARGGRSLSPFPRRLPGAHRRGTGRGNHVQHPPRGRPSRRNGGQEAGRHRRRPPRDPPTNPGGPARPARPCPAPGRVRRRPAPFEARRCARPAPRDSGARPAAHPAADQGLAGWRRHRPPALRRHRALPGARPRRLAGARGITTDPMFRRIWLPKKARPYGPPPLSRLGTLPIAPWAVAAIVKTRATETGFGGGILAATASSAAPSALAWIAANTPPS
jgi:hypothetical protein